MFAATIAKPVAGIFNTMVRAGTAGKIDKADIWHHPRQSHANWKEQCSVLQPHHRVGRGGGSRVGHHTLQNLPSLLQVRLDTALAGSIGHANTASSAEALATGRNYQPGAKPDCSQNEQPARPAPQHKDTLACVSSGV